MPRRGRDWIGIRQKWNRWEAYLRVNGEFRRTSFPLDTPVQIMQGWRTQQKRHRSTIVKGSLADDIATYLTTIRHMRTAKEREAQLALWAAALGPLRSRYTVTAPEIHAVLSQWAVSGHQGTGNPRARVKVGGPLSPSTLHHRRLALLGLYRTLGGPGGYNPVREVKVPPARPVESRAVPLPRIAAVLQQLANSPRQGRKTYARLLVMLTTGLPHKSLTLLTPADVDLEHKILRVKGRGKGKGARGRILPLSDAALEAFAVLEREDAWGTFSASAMHSAAARAAARAKVPTFRPYDVRHVHGALIYQLTRDLDTAARLLGHTSTDQTRRYASEAFVVVDTSAEEQVGAALARYVEVLKRSREE